MCGIVAIIGQSNSHRASMLHKSLKTLELRGPDDCGIWNDQFVSIGHRRLSVMGETNGRQPISSTCGNIVVACNGELYGYKQLRDVLRNEYVFKTESDSEILIPLYLKYGIEGMMKYLIGEFAFTLYDKRTGTLYAVRDRFGIKPLCWFHDKGCSIIASKAKAIIACGVKAEWDNISLMQSLSMHYQPADRTMFANIRQVEPGHILVFSGKPRPTP